MYVTLRVCWMWILPDEVCTLEHFLPWFLVASVPFGNHCVHLQLSVEATDHGEIKVVFQMAPNTNKVVHPGSVMILTS